MKVSVAAGCSANSVRIISDGVGRDADGAAGRMEPREAITHSYSSTAGTCNRGALSA